MSAAVTLALLFFLSVALNEQVTEGCRCLPKHPQQQFCASDIVIRAKVIGTVPSTLPQLTAYRIQTIQDLSRTAGSFLIYATVWSLGTNSPEFKRCTSAGIREAVSVRSRPVLERPVLSRFFRKNA
ncbi:uncharacterized protein [Sinocyclocheilus grahami]|uniref:uncharacterized protein isoform X4 n=1 Tax=Sinocyclocheilus grahami TaxID=75366 RepID=UPI0007AD30FB|nr:PREDICTED: uncharacterized protein LOC107571220 isoform X4 [Sinocyclocheilus grahami]